MPELTTLEGSGDVEGDGWGFPVVYDEIIRERDGRNPHQFPGWDTWDETDEAKNAFERGLAEADRTRDEFWDRGTGRLLPLGPERDTDRAVAKRGRPKRRTRR